MRVDEFNYELPAELIAQRPQRSEMPRDCFLWTDGEKSGGSAIPPELPDSYAGTSCWSSTTHAYCRLGLFGHRAHKVHHETAPGTFERELEVFLCRKWQRTDGKRSITRHASGRTRVGQAKWKRRPRGELGLRTIHFKSNNEYSIRSRLLRSSATSAASVSTGRTKNPTGSATRQFLHGGHGGRRRGYTSQRKF